MTIATVDALLGRRDLSDEEWEDVRAHLDDRRVIELLLLAGHYDMLATTINVLRIQPDVPRRTGSSVSRPRHGRTSHAEAHAQP